MRPTQTPVKAHELPWWNKGASEHICWYFILSCQGGFWAHFAELFLNAENENLGIMSDCCNRLQHSCFHGNNHTLGVMSWNVTFFIMQCNKSTKFFFSKPMIGVATLGHLPESDYKSCIMYRLWLNHLNSTATCHYHTYWVCLKGHYLEVTHPLTNFQLPSYIIHLGALTLSWEYIHGPYLRWMHSMKNAVHQMSDSDMVKD